MHARFLNCLHRPFELRIVLEGKLSAPFVAVSAEGVQRSRR